MQQNPKPKTQNNLRQHALTEQMRSRGITPRKQKPEWKPFWDYISSIAALRGKKMVFRSDEEPATPVADRASSEGPPQRSAGERLSAPPSSSLPPVREDPEDPIENDEDEPPLQRGKVFLSFSFFSHFSFFLFSFLSLSSFAF